MKDIQPMQLAISHQQSAINHEQPRLTYPNLIEAGRRLDLALEHIMAIMRADLTPEERAAVAARYNSEARDAATVIIMASYLRLPMQEC